MRTIHVKYDEVYAEAARLKNHISSNIVDRANTEYRMIQSNLSRMDGAANAVLMEVMEENRRKTIMAADTLGKLLDFIASSTKQIEVNEQRIAQAMTAGRR